MRRWTSKIKGRRDATRVTGSWPDASVAEIDIMSAFTAVRGARSVGAAMQCMHTQVQRQAVYTSPLYGLTSKGKPVPLLSNSPPTYGLVLNLPRSVAADHLSTHRFHLYIFLSGTGANSKSRINAYSIILICMWASL